MGRKDLNIKGAKRMCRHRAEALSRSTANKLEHKGEKMEKAEFVKKLQAIIDEIENPCEWCSDDDFKPEDCKYYDPLFDKEDGHPSFCLKPEPIDEIIQLVEEYKIGRT